ncbi:DUF58 domain-containing protein [bacterium]|nr:DUF58 domain-containing protein [bacterium]
MKQKPQDKIFGIKNYLLLNIVVLITSINTGLNLLFFISIIMMVILILSYYMGKKNIDKVEIQRFYKKEIFEEERVDIIYEIFSNDDKFFLEFKDHIPFVKNSISSLYLDNIQKGTTRRVENSVFFNFPGIFYFQRIEISSSYPLPFLRFKRSVLVNDRIVVYPKYFDITFFPEHLMNIKSESEQFKSRIGYGDDIWGIKPYEFGDRIRDIDWKLSLKLDDILVKVREKKLGKKAWVIPLIKNQLYTEDNSDIIRMSASIIKNRVDNEYAVGEVVGGKVLIPQLGREQIYLLLKELSNIWNVNIKDQKLDLYFESYLKSSIVFIVSNESPRKHIALISDLKKYGNSVIYIYIKEKIDNAKDLMEYGIANEFFIYITDSRHMEMVFEE